MKWVTGSPVTIQHFSSLQCAERSCCIYYYWCCNVHSSNIPVKFGLKKPFCEKINGNKSSLRSVNKCIVMLLQNFTEPKWLSVECNRTFLKYVLCVRDKIIQEIEHSNNISVKRKHFCTSNANLVHGTCYDFQWSDSIVNRYTSKAIKIDIMIFKYIFEAIALEDRQLSAFMKYNLKIISSVTFVRYLDTVTFVGNVSLPDREGYIICPSEKSKTQLGTHIFSCSDGGYILNQYICDGAVDCPNDRSDENDCACNRSKHSKMCKIFNQRQTFNICSSMYYMTTDGNCLKYTNPNNIYQIFQTNISAP